MSSAEQEMLKSNLASLEKVLGDKSPFIRDNLAPGASPSDLESLRAELGGAQVESLETWYRWHNGCTDRLTDLMPLGRMLSISEAIEDRRQEQSTPFVDAKRSNAIKILADSAGDGYFLDVASESPRVFYHMLEDPFPRNYGTLTQFVEFLADVHQAGIASPDEHGMVDFDLDRYQQIEAAYLAKIGS